jgi:hypothetical protein
MGEATTRTSLEVELEMGEEKVGFKLKSRIGGVDGVLMCEGVAGCKREKRLRVWMRCYIRL